MADTTSTQSLEQELEALLDQETFEPPEEFRERALWNDPKVYDEANADPQAWWAGQAKELLDWFTEPTQILDDSDPPFYKWFTDGKINASHNCLDRHVEAGNGDRLAFPWPGGGGGPRGGPHADPARDGH